ncbi:hypothetical protein [Synechococcus sp. PCC 6312]|uniref:hypothetical protein n=1 Tax=Synechococcus sp. (strain ATCC 27167 / PCC 6312) TaxID=195253 RepID=UPI00029EE196|nr:hypothetical protein [Synechococcus sp. PCC 6312]AFY59870.1 hypothetical protein Syn6312_0649 [Synechococcus sp. PCC 6312]
MAAMHGSGEPDLAQFHHRYPTGSLTADLLQIHDGLFIVQAKVQVGGTTLATGLGAAPAIEQAEDLARQRALAVLGIVITTYEPPAHLIGTVSQALLNPARPQPLPESTYSFPEAEAPQSWQKPEDPQSSLFMDDTPPPSPPSRPSRPPARPQSEPTPPPLDLSDVIAQTTVELKRLGWTEVQGRSYLQRTYKKRSRQQLSDDELLEFLDYLRQQPGSGEPDF